MSADRDRGIRRQKQKRAKQRKKQSRQQVPVAIGRNAKPLAAETSAAPH